MPKKLWTKHRHRNFRITMFSLMTTLVQTLSSRKRKRWLSPGEPVGPREEQSVDCLIDNYGEIVPCTLHYIQSQIKGQGTRGNFDFRAPMYFMTSSFVKVMLSLIHNVLVCFFRLSRMCLINWTYSLLREGTFVINTEVYSYWEKIFHKLESDSARNNIHPNNKQKPEIQTNTPEK